MAIQTIRDVELTISSKHPSALLTELVRDNECIITGLVLKKSICRVQLHMINGRVNQSVLNLSNIEQCKIKSLSVLQLSDILLISTIIKGSVIRTNTSVKEESENVTKD